MRVIVELRTDFVPEGKLTLFGAANQRTAIDGQQQRVLARVAGAQNVKRFQSVPLMAMTVTAGRLQALIDNRDVAAIYEDVAVPPALDASVPVIRADVAAGIGRINGGKGWSVVVLDTGVQRRHEAFRRKIASEACFSTSSADSKSLCPGGAQSSTAKGAGNTCRRSMDGCGHGTHVAGIAVGNPKGAEAIYAGVAPKASLIPIQVFSRFSGSACAGAGPCVLSYTSDQLAALEHVNALASGRKIAAVNMSLGGGLRRKACGKHPLAPIIETLRSKRIAVVIAAGNAGADGRVSAPGCIPAAITVASTTKTEDVSSFSNFSKLVDLAAPGSDITSTILGNRFAVLSGTSMAAPHVAGALALLRHRFPKASVRKLRRALRCSSTRVTRNGVTVPRIDVYTAFLALKNRRCTL
ncbi:S8 family peptidase [Microbaculum marinisediminis]|nr:S8 family serine peptidase [Microbaculum sp. A6E488]